MKLYSLVAAKKLVKDKSNLPKVSVLIAAYNEEKVIRETVETLLASEYPKDRFEVIVGSDNSKDKTHEIMQELAETDSRVKFYPFFERNGKPGVLNRIEEKAFGDVLVFCDSNILFDKNALMEMASLFADKRVGGVSGEIKLKKSKTGNQEGTYWRLESRIKDFEGKVGSLIGANGGMYAIRRELYWKYPVGETIQDDILMTLKVISAGFDFTYDTSAFSHEEPTATNEDEFKRKKRIQVSNLGTLRYVKEFLNPFAGFTAFALWSHKILRWFSPHLLLLVIFCNLFLLDYSSFFMLSIYSIAATINLAVLGYFFNAVGQRFLPFLLFYYFYGTLGALLAGSFKYYFRKTTATWEPTKRV
ncbi:MAG: glycosyltransferase [Ignavibacteriales bacterium]|nr:glycosyltransferase [Ignavibacteriales bacterium]